jgi:NTE family protein
MKPKISLILSSGGARGYAHIGVIEALEQAGYEIVSISGSSMGALIGGLYAAGKMQEYKEWVLKLDFLSVISLVDFSFSSGGMIKGEKVFEKMEPFLKAFTIEDLPIKFTAVATDLNSKKEIWFQEGNLRDAIRASIAIPTILTPVLDGDRILVDGGVLNPMPVAPTMSDHVDLRIAVNLNASHIRPLKKPAMPKTEQKKQHEAESRFESFLSKIGLKKDKAPKEKRDTIGRFDMLNRTLDTMQASLTRYKIAGYAPDILVQVPASSCRFYDFHKAYEMIAVGKEAAIHALEKYHEQQKGGVV